MPETALNTLILVVLISSSSGLFNEQQHKKIARVDRLEICENDDDSPFIWGAIRLQNIPKSATLFHTNLTITKDVNQIHGIGILYRCSHKEVLDSCEYFTSLKLTNLCELLKKNGTSFSPFVYGFHPPFLCPFRKGQYQLVNGTWDMAIFNFFPVEHFYWNLKLQVFDGTFKKLYYSLCAEGKCI